MKIGVVLLRIYGWTWWLRTLCWSISQLDRIPRYGRTYSVDRETRKISKPQWRYFRHGHWGMYMLDKLGLFWPYLDYRNPGWDDVESP